MSYPLVFDKYQQKSLTRSEDLLSYMCSLRSSFKKNRGSLPQRAIMCFSKSLARRWKKQASFQKSLPPAMTGLNIDRHQGLKQPLILVSGVGIGGASAVVALEKLRALGVREIISLGVMGTLNSKLAIGTPVLCLKALRDEGCSYHYQAIADFVEIKLQPLQKIWAQKHAVQKVTTWSTSAPFRVTHKELIKWKLEGVECIDMEAASLMSAGDYHGMSVLCMGVVSDDVTEKGWSPQFFHPQVRKNLGQLLSQIFSL